MTKRIKDFGDSIEGGRRKRNNRVLNQENKNAIENDGGKDLTDTYSLASKIRERGEIYCIQEKQKKELHNRKKRFQLPKLTSVCRTGPEYLPDGRHADEHDFKELGIRGVEFGDSLSDEEAQSSLDECYLALCDLARILNIDKKDVSLGGTLALSFGSRGYGGSEPATYDPQYQVINFTRGGGAGSLAHGWAHALDYYIGRSCRLGRNGDDAPVSSYVGMEGVPPTVNALLRGMATKREALTPDEQIQMMKENHDSRVREEDARCREILQAVTPENLTEGQRKAWNQAIQEIYDTKSSANLNRYVLKNYPNRAIEELSKVHKEITGYVIPKEKRRKINYAFTFLDMAERRSMDTREIKWKEKSTEFYKNSWEMGEHYAKTTHGSHSDNCERLARAFECYVADKLEKERNQSQYLTAHSEAVVLVRENGEKVYGGPVGEERDEINRMFDAMFWELKEIGVLHWRNMEKIVEKNKKMRKYIQTRC